MVTRLVPFWIKALGLGVFVSGPCRVPAGNCIGLRGSGYRDYIGSRAGFSAQGSGGLRV